MGWDGRGGGDGVGLEIELEAVNVFGLRTGQRGRRGCSRSVGKPVSGIYHLHTKMRGLSSPDAIGIGNPNDEGVVQKKSLVGTKWRGKNRK